MLTQAEVIFPLTMISSQNFRPNKCNCGAHTTAPFAEVPSPSNRKPTDFRRWYGTSINLVCGKSIYVTATICYPLGWVLSPQKENVMKNVHRYTVYKIVFHKAACSFTEQT